MLVLVVVGGVVVVVVVGGGGGGHIGRRCSLLPPPPLPFPGVMIVGGIPLNSLDMVLSGRRGGGVLICQCRGH